jgi:hypothetical protein
MLRMLPADPDFWSEIFPKASIALLVKIGYL